MQFGGLRDCRKASRALTLNPLENRAADPVFGSEVRSAGAEDRAVQEPRPGKEAVARTAAEVVRDRAALLASPCQSRAGSSAYHRPPGRAAADGRHLSVPAGAAGRGADAASARRTAFCAADPRLVAKTPGHALAGRSLRRAGPRFERMPATCRSSSASPARRRPPAPSAMLAPRPSISPAAPISSSLPRWPGQRR
jgi:hypothetical protein